MVFETNENDRAIDGVEERITKGNWWEANNAQIYTSSPNFSRILPLATYYQLHLDVA